MCWQHPLPAWGPLVKSHVDINRSCATPQTREEERTEKYIAVERQTRGNAHNLLQLKPNGHQLQYIRKLHSLNYCARQSSHRPHVCEQSPPSIVSCSSFCPTDSTEQLLVSTSHSCIKEVDGETMSPAPAAQGLGNGPAGGSNG
ncbi:hypothetical protein C0Q70_09890 [Pomacea canaliculata]|uniref:Uncharacterized protein n=1 Tax=Pomacea canaliculata TaxID=400727 RepID=A0A2T7PB26_POMCA|nr:hypothetical protein C0Q70_09890 [Pomacea canaliculata]